MNTAWQFFMGKSSLRNASLESTHEQSHIRLSLRNLQLCHKSPRRLCVCLILYFRLVDKELAALSRK
jgi:hypothetical protein